MITIPEIEDRGWSTENFYLFILRQLQYEVDFLRERVPRNGSIELRDFQLSVVERIVRMGASFLRQVSESWDVEVVGATVRILADYVSGYYLIYGASNNDERLLRHYLYIMDGFKHRLKDINVEVVDDGRISHDEYLQLRNQMERAKSSYNSVILSSIDHIRALPIYSKQSKAIEMLIKDANWKYKAIAVGEKTSKNFYSWQEMYLRLELNGAVHFSEFSCYVHGLSTCQLQVDRNAFAYSMTAVVVALLSKLQELVHTNFNITEDDQRGILTRMLENGELGNLLTPEFVESINM